MKISEIFKSLQGEGPSLGRPAVFLRLAGCNLRCSWCDTPYAQKGGEECSIESVVERLKKVGVEQTKYLVITGGEPILQIEEIRELIFWLQDSIRVGIETNGTAPPGKVTEYDISTFINDMDVIGEMEYIVSPKLLNSGNSDGMSQFCREWTNYTRKSNVTFKFVAGSKKDIVDIESFVRAYEIPRQLVWLMPQCITSNRHIELMPLLFESAVQYGFNLSPRLHILAYQNKRGV